jgi:serine palmitoyltransferase
MGVDTEEHPPKLSAIQTAFIYFGYGMLFIFGRARDFIDKLFGGAMMVTPKGYAPLFVDSEYFYIRRLFQRIRDCWDRPICSVPGAWIEVLERQSNDKNETFFFTGRKLRCLNLGSYNYLGFANNDGPVLEAAVEANKEYSTATTSPACEGGYTQIHRDLEKTVARFVGKEDAVIFEMGFATNSTTLPVLIGKGGLILSDSLNHTSIVTGCRHSGAVIRTFKHNNMQDLERVIRHAIIYGQPNGQPWDMILLVVEGIYSMEGVICKLKDMIALKKKYNIFLYVDEAHSIGALGPSGRGVVEHTGVSPDDIDILMGTFTKSFGSVGGYLASSKELIRYIRMSSYGTMYAASMSAGCAQQALSALLTIMGEDGTDIGRKKIAQLRDNSNYFRSKLVEMGFIIFGNRDSPIIPMMIYHPAKMPGFSRNMLKRGVAVVVVGAPATHRNESRARFCISAAHTRDDLDWALKEIQEVGDLCLLRYAKK